MKKASMLRVITIYGLEILAAIVGAVALCGFIAYPIWWKLAIGVIASGFSVMVDYRNDGWE